MSIVVIINRLLVLEEIRIVTYPHVRELRYQRVKIVTLYIERVGVGNKKGCNISGTVRCFIHITLLTIL